MLLVSVFKLEVYVSGLLTMALCIGLYTLLERYSVGKVGEIPARPPSTSDSIMTAVRVPLYQGKRIYLIVDLSYIFINITDVVRNRNVVNNESIENANSLLSMTYCNQQLVFPAI